MSCSSLPSPLCVPCGKPANLLYRIPSLPPYTISTLSVSPFLDVYICICASLSAGFGGSPASLDARPFPFFPFPFYLFPPFLSDHHTHALVSSREYKKGWAHECLVTLSAFLIPPLILPLLSLVPHRSLCLAISLVRWISVHMSVHLRACFFSFFLSFFFCPPPLFFSFFLYFLVRFWLRHSPCSMYFVKPTVVPITSARVQPAPDLVASSMKLIRLVPGSRCRHTNFTSRRQLER